MIELKTQYPYDDNTNLIRHYAEDESGEQYCIEQVETGFIYADAVDKYPCKYTYTATDKKVEKPEIQPRGESLEAYNE